MSAFQYQAKTFSDHRKVSACLLKKKRKKKKEMRLVGQKFNGTQTRHKIISVHFIIKRYINQIKG